MKRDTIISGYILVRRLSSAYPIHPHGQLTDLHLPAKSHTIPRDKTESNIIQVTGDGYIINQLNRISFLPFRNP